MSAKKYDKRKLHKKQHEQIKKEQLKSMRPKGLCRKIAAILAAVFLALIPAVYVGDEYGYIPILVVFFTLTVSFVYGLLLKHFVSYAEVSELENCIRGTNMEFTVRIKNKSFLILPKLTAFFYISDLFGEIDSVTSVSLTLAPFEEREFCFTINFAHIGTYSAGLKQLHVYGLLDLFCFTIRNESRYKIDVNPRVHPYLDMVVNEVALYENLQSSVVSAVPGMDYSGVREYVFGDPIKMIHWKLSAHSKTYMTKIMESYGTSGITVVLDLASPQYDSETLMNIFDGVVEAAVSVCYYAKECGMEYDLVYYDKDRQKKRYIPTEFNNTMDLMVQLPQITTDTQAYNANRLVLDERNSLYAKNNLAVCSANITEELIETLLEAKKNKRNVILFYVIPADVYDKERADLMRPLRRLEAAKITYYVFSSVEELRRAV